MPVTCNPPEPYTGVMPKSGGLTVEEEIAACVAYRSWHQNTYMPWMQECFPTIAEAALLGNTLFDLSNYKGVYDPATTYALGDTVSVGESIYLSSIDNNTEVAGVGASWIVISSRESVILSLKTSSSESQQIDEGTTKLIPCSFYQGTHPDWIAAGIVTIDIEGYYFIDVSLLVKMFEGEAQGKVHITHNQAVLSSDYFNYASGWHTETLSAVAYINQGDTISITVEVEMGSVLVVDNILPYNHINIQRIGA